MELHEVAERASAMDFDRTVKVGDRASESQPAGVYGTGFALGSLVGIDQWV